MEPLALLREAKAAHLKVTLDGDGLHVEGPRSAEAIVERLRQQKSDVVRALETLCGWCGEWEANGGNDPAGVRWCSACRDAEHGLQAIPPVLLAGRELREAWAGAVRELGELLGHPQLSFKPGHAVSLGPIGWQQFVARASADDLRLVLARLRVLVAELPSPECGAL